MLEEVGFQQGAPLAERKVLAFAPDALPLRLDSERQVRAALMGLVQVVLCLSSVLAMVSIQMGVAIYGCSSKGRKRVPDCLQGSHASTAPS